MPLTTAGRNHIASDVSRLGGLTAFDATNAFVAVGDSAAAFAVGQTDLQAATNKLRKGMMATFPSAAVNVITFKGSYGLTDANFAWNEFGIFNASSAGTMLIREVPATLGTKPSTEVWELTITVTYS